MSDDERRQSPRMPNTGIVKEAYLVLTSDQKEQLLECSVIDICEHGIKGRLKEPGDFRYQISDNLDIPARIVFNNDRVLNLASKIVWYKDQPEYLDFGLHFLGSIW